jgi:hypothetical protein
LRNLEQVHGEPVLPTEVFEFMGEFSLVAKVVDAVLVDLGVNDVHAGLLLRQDFTDVHLRLEVAVERVEGRLEMPSQVCWSDLESNIWGLLEGIEMTCPASEGIFAQTFYSVKFRFLFRKSGFATWESGL